MKDIYNRMSLLEKENKYMYYLFKYSGCILNFLLCLLFQFKTNEIIGDFALAIIIYSTLIGGYLAGAISMIFSLSFMINLPELFKGDISAYNLILVSSLAISIILVDNIRKKNYNIKSQVLKKQDLYRDILDRFSDGILVLENRNLLFCNKFCENLLGIDLKTIKNSNNGYEEICNKLNIEKEIESIRNKKKLIFVKQANQNNVVRTYRFQIVKKFHNKKELTIILIYDITKKLVYENALLKAEHSYNDLVQNIPNGIILHDNKKILYANNTTLKMMKVSNLEQVKNKYIDEFIVDEYKETFNKQINSVIEKYINDAKSTYLKIKDSEKNIVEVEVSTALMPYSNKKMVTLIYNKTEAKELDAEKKSIDEALKYEKMKLEFFANMSHEFKTPLNILFTSIQTIELYLKTSIIYDESNRLKKYLKTMKQNCYRQLRLINNLIDITKLDAGFYEINYKSVNIVELIENISLSIVDYAQQKGIEVIFDTEDEEIIIAVDEEKVERIILNLLSNAVKFTGNGDEIKIKLYKDCNSVYVSVKDTGIGIKEEELNIVFDRFKQAHNNSLSKGQGSGIGLSLVKSLVELHNGKIEIKSKEFQGTEFIITFPRETIVMKDNELEVQGVLNKNTNIEKINVEFSDIYY